MNRSAKNYARQRAPRVKLSGSILVLLGLADRQHVRGKLHQLSVNGGLLQLTEPLEASAPVEILFHVGSTTVRAQAATLIPIWATQGCLQPFRFTDMPQEDRNKLQSDLQRLLAGPVSIEEGTDRGVEISTRPPAADPHEVVLYFDRPEEAFRFTVAVSSVISAENRATLKEDFVRLARSLGKVSRVTTKGVLNVQGRQADSLIVAS